MFQNSFNNSKSRRIDNLFMYIMLSIAGWRCKNYIQCKLRVDTRQFNAEDNAILQFKQFFR